MVRAAPYFHDRVLYVTHWDTKPRSDAAENLGDRQLPVPGANDGAPGVGLFVALGDALRGAPEVVNRVWEKAKELGHDDVFVSEEMGGITDDHVPLLRAGLRVIDIIDLEYPHQHRPSDTLDKISARSLSIVGEVAEALLR